MLKRLCIYLLVLIITTYLGIAYLETFPTVLLGVEYMFALLSLIYVFLSSWGLRAAFSAPSDTITVGRQGEIRAYVKNRSVLPVFYAELVVELTYFQSSEVFTLRLPFTALPGKMQRMYLPITVRYSGTMRITPKYICVYDFLHLFSMRKKLKSKSATVTVLPEFQQLFIMDRSSRFSMPVIEERVTEDDDARKNIQQFYKDRVGDDPAEVYQVRDYHIGDKLSRVDWKLSAKSGSLMVKDYSFPIVDRTVIMVDMHCENQMAYHQRIHTAVALCISALEMNCSITLAWYDMRSQMVLQRHLEKDEDLFESIGMLTAATYCQNILPAEMMGRLSLPCQLEQLIYITGAVSEDVLVEMECLEQTKRIWIYSIAKEEMRTEQLSEKLTCYMLPRGSLEKALAQLRVELY